MKKSLKLGLTLLLFAGLSALVLAYVNNLTSSVILAQEQEKELEQQKEIFPEGQEFEILEVSSSLDKVKTMTKVSLPDGDAYIFKTLPNGYDGPMEVMVGIKADGTIAGVRIGNNGETVGVGDRVTKPDFYQQFKDTKIDEYKGDGQPDSVSTISGATISSTAVITGIRYAQAAFEEVSP